MKILHVITSLEIGGAQRLLADILPILAKAESVSLLVFKRVFNEFEKNIENKGIEIISMNQHNFYNPSAILRMRKIFKDFDLIHVHLFPTLYWASLAAIGLKVKLVYTVHSTFDRRRNKRYFRPIERFIHSRYDKIISISQQTQDAITSWLGQDDERFIVINNGVDTEKFTSLNVPVVPKSLIMVSRFASSKDQETVIRAMQYVDKEANLRLVGDGEHRHFCENLATELGVSDRIHFLGSRTDVPELVASSYIGIQSSNWEGFGLTAVEIMACGKPVIATNVDGLMQVVEGAGEVFTRGNAIELAQKINYLLKNLEYYNAMADRCRQRANVYNISVMSENYLQLYKSMMII